MSEYLPIGETFSVETLVEQFNSKFGTSVTVAQACSLLGQISDIRIWRHNNNNSHHTNLQVVNKLVLLKMLKLKTLLRCCEYAIANCVPFSFSSDSNSLIPACNFSLQKRQNNYLWKFWSTWWNKQLLVIQFLLKN